MPCRASPAPDVRPPATLAIAATLLASCTLALPGAPGLSLHLGGDLQVRHRAGAPQPAAYVGGRASVIRLR